MPHYYLNLFNDIDALDEEGAEFADVHAATSEAIESARELMADHIRMGRPIDLAHRIEIASSNGEVLTVVRFRDLITITDSETSPD